MDANSIEAQPNLAPQPDQGNTLEIPSKLKSANPFTPRQELINAIVGQESGGKKAAVGKVGELGLMQVRPETAAQYGVTPEQLRDPAVNRNVGTRYFSDMLKRYQGNEFLALAAYNSGPGRVDKGQLLPQSIKYATKILDAAKRPQGPASAVPLMESQTVGAAKPKFAPSIAQSAQPESQGSSLLSKIGSFFEGTANAEELPPLPSGMKPVMQVGKEPTDAELKPTPAGSAVPPAAKMPPNLPPLPSGMKPTFDPSRFKTSFGIGPGGLHMNVQSVQQPASVRTQEATANIVLGQVNDAIGFYDKAIKPREGEFTGNLLTQGGRRGLAQPFESTHSLWAQELGLGGKGGQADPQVQSFYDKVGPVMAEQLKTLIGGRVGQGMIDGPLAPHLPNIDKDSLPRIRAKLEDLKANIPIIIKNIADMRAQGMTDDQILAAPPAWPNDQGQPTSTPDFSPDEQELINRYQ